MNPAKFSGLCFDCGTKYGRKPRMEATTCWPGRCYCCAETKTVTAERDFGYPTYPDHPEYTAQMNKETQKEIQGVQK